MNSLNKTKICFGCEKDKYIWKRIDNKPYCKSCSIALKNLSLLASKVEPNHKVVIKYNNTKKVYKIPPINKKRIEALKVYKRKRDKFLDDNPICMFPGCNSTEVTCHHSKGRIGAFLTDKRYFKALCWPHHKYVEEHPEEAIRLGLSYKRLEK